MHHYKEKAVWPFYTNPSGLNEILYATCSAGLSNRIFTLAGCQRIAEVTRRNLALYWPVNGSDGVGCNFNDLFKMDVHLISEWDFYWMLDTAHSLKVYNPEQPIDVRDRETIVLIRSWGSPRFSGDDYGTAMGEIHSRIRKLVPTDALQKLIDSSVARVKPGSVGVHARSVNWHENKPTPFFCRIDHACAGRPIFLSTDSMDVTRDFVRRYGSRVTVQNKLAWGENGVDRSSKEGMFEALCDLYSLGACEEIIGTRGSSFTQLAGALGKIEPHVI